MPLYQKTFLRRIILPVLKLFKRVNCNIRHPYTGASFRLNVYKHKGYWYHGRRREELSMNLFSELINPTDVIIEVGGHIGFIAVYFATLAKKGRVIVFEPGSNNLPYLRNNTKSYSNLEIVESAVGDVSGEIEFHLEDITGQNNSVLATYSIFEANAENAFSTNAYTKCVVPMVALNEFCRQNGVVPQFIKIDVEGFENNVLLGMSELLEKIRPICMVEVTEQHEQIFNFLVAAGYRLFTPKRAEIKSRIPSTCNVFALHQDKHAATISRVFIS